MRDGRLERTGYGRFPTLSFLDQGRSLGEVIYQVVDGSVQIMGSSLDASLSMVAGTDILGALVAELTHRYGGRRPLLAVERSRRPDAPYWESLICSGRLETLEMYETK